MGNATQHRRDDALLLASLTLVLFVSPSVSWWFSDSLPWYLPYLLWLGVIMIAAWSARPRTRREHLDDD